MDETLYEILFVWQDRVYRCIVGVDEMLKVSDTCLPYGYRIIGIGRF